MNSLLQQAIPMMAATFGLGFLYQLYRQGQVQTVRRRKTERDYYRELEMFEDEVPPPADARGSFDTMESALTLSFTVVCLEALCFLVYLYLTPSNGSEPEMLRSFRGNVLGLMGMAVVTVAGMVRVRRLMK
jgi:hypothetical protein